MTDLDRVRSVAMLLPEAGEQEQDGGWSFSVDGKVFARLDRADGGTVAVRSDAAHAAGPHDAADGWRHLDAGADADWTLIEDQIARSWELTAPRRLLEAGGR